MHHSKPSSHFKVDSEVCPGEQC